MKTFKYIWVPIYQANVWWFRGPRKQYDKLVWKEFKREAPEKRITVNATVEEYLIGDQRVHVIWLKNHKVHVLAHECFHAAYHILRDRGVYLTDGSEEAFAYLMDFLIQEIRK